MTVGKKKLFRVSFIKKKNIPYHLSLFFTDGNILQIDTTYKVWDKNFSNGASLTIPGALYLTIILRNRAEYRLILSRRGRRPSRLKSDDIPRDWAG